MASSSKKSKSKRRLTADERREKILACAVPLFAEVGFRGATTKRIAKDAGVSEALLYQHFPSKEALHAEVQDYLCNKHPALVVLLSERPPSTELLVFLLYMIAQLIIDPPQALDVGRDLVRVMLQSVLDDGTFARTHIERNMSPIIALASQAVAAARRAGDMGADDGMPDDLRYIFAHHVVVMVHMGSLPATKLFDYPDDKDKMIDHLMRFTLRGIGLSEPAIRKHWQPARMKAELLASLRAATAEEEGS